MPLKNGEAFAGFVIQRFLGAGAMGEVYLVQHPRLPRLDALKVLPPTLTDSAEYRYRFNREAELASTLWHSNIVGIHDCGEFNGQLWISMDYVDGTDAAQLIQDKYRTGMPTHEVLEIVTAVADALDLAHKRGLLHRDVKPANILLAHSEGGRRRTLLADFGIARQADEVSGFTGTNMTLGSIGYAAPEQLMGQPIDGRADQYSLAVTTFHLLTGTMPFQDSNPAVVISKQVTTPAPILSERRPDLANIDRALAVALAKDPNQRYPHCLDFAEALSRASRRPYTQEFVAPAASAPKPDATRAMSIPSTESPKLTAEGRGNLLADPQWADALSAFFAGRWVEAVGRFETLQASYPGERRVESRLKEARRQRDIGTWSSKAETSATEHDWDTVVTALENLSVLDPAYPDVGAQLEHARTAQRRKALVDEIMALQHAGRWDAVAAAARELARIDPGNADSGGIVSEARAELCEAELPDGHPQATEDKHQASTPPAQPLPDSMPTALSPSAAPAAADAALKRRRYTGRLVAVCLSVIGAALAGGMIVFTTSHDSKSPTTPASQTTPTSTSNTTATTSASPTTVEVSGPNETIAGYIKNAGIQATTITPGTPGAPTVDLPVPDGWTRIPEGAGTPFFGIVFTTPTNPADPPKITASLQKLTGNVDTDKLLAVSPGEVKNLPGYAGLDGQASTLNGHPASQLGGLYTKNGVSRVVVQKTVVIRSADVIYVMQIKGDGPQSDADALNAATSVIDEMATIAP